MGVSVLTEEEDRVRLILKPSRFLRARNLGLIQMEGREFSRHEIAPPAWDAAASEFAWRAHMLGLTLKETLADWVSLSDDDVLTIHIYGEDNYERPI